MSSVNDFVIKNGVLEKYIGEGGDVIIPDGVTSIGEWAFSSCNSLTSITLPDSVTSIGKHAFYNCKKMVSITITNSVTRIEEGTFEYCGSLTSITIPDSVTCIGDEAFHDCSSLISVTLSASLTSINGSTWGGAFRGCSSLTSIKIPDSVTSIGERAFCECSSIKSITIPDSVTSIGSGAFKNCKSLEDFALSGVHAKIAKDMFGDKLPSKLAEKMEELYPNMADGALKQYVLTKTTWERLDSALREEIFLTRQGKALEQEYAKLITAKETAPLGETILQRLQAAKPTAKDFGAAAAYMTLFHETAPVDILNALYRKLKEIKSAASAVKKIETHVALMEKLGGSVEVDENLSSAAQKVMAFLITEKKNLKDLEQSLKDYFSLSIKDLPRLDAADGTAAEPWVLAWLLTIHTCMAEDMWGNSVVSEKYEKPGLCPEAAEVAAMLEPLSLQEAVGKIADEYLVKYQNTKKKFLAYPVCRYADEATITELTTRAPKWASSVSGNDAPPLKQFRDAVKYSNTRAAMLFAERYHELGAYAKIRGMSADTIRDLYLSDVGLDEQGGKNYDLGIQTVTARLQKDLSFLFELPGSKTAKSLPKKGADGAKYEAANKDFSEMKKAVKKILNSRGKVLFDDFLTGRERVASEWQEAYLKNPLLCKAASLVVWAQGKKTFTLQDRNPISSSEQAYTITDKPKIRVAHPMEMSPTDIEMWQKYFTAHGLKQPFTQIWEPVRKAEDIKEDRYKNCMIPYYRFLNMEKHGITVQDYDFHDEIDISFDCCSAYVERIDLHRHAVESTDRFEIKEISFEKYTRKVNHLIAYLDRITVWDRVQKDDTSVMDQIPGFTLAQITEFITAAQEANAVNVLAALLEYKNANFADFDPMAEFTLEW